MTVRCNLTSHAAALEKLSSLATHRLTSLQLCMTCSPEEFYRTRLKVRLTATAEASSHHISTCIIFVLSHALRSIQPNRKNQRPAAHRVETEELSWAKA